MGLISAPQVFTWTVLPNPVQIAPPTLPDPLTDEPYSQRITASAGDGGPYTFSLVGGALPAGFSLSTSGLITGTATASAILGPASWPAGVVDQPYSQQLVVTESAAVGVSSTFTVQAADGSGGTATQTYTVTVRSGWTSPYGPYVEVLAGTTAPKCLRVSTTGLVSGHPMTVGTSSFSVQAQNRLGVMVTLTATITVTS